MQLVPTQLPKGCSRVLVSRTRVGKLFRAFLSSEGITPSFGTCATHMNAAGRALGASVTALDASLTMMGVGTVVVWQWHMYHHDTHVPQAWTTVLLLEATQRRPGPRLVGSPMSPTEVRDGCAFLVSEAHGLSDVRFRCQRHTSWPPLRPLPF